MGRPTKHVGRAECTRLTGQQAKGPAHKTCGTHFPGIGLAHLQSGVHIKATGPAQEVIGPAQLARGSHFPANRAGPFSAWGPH
jgi:hypothetical protein